MRDLAILLLSSTLAIGALELGLRAFVPHSRLLDRDDDAFWKVRFQEQAADLDLSEGRLGNGQFHPTLGWIPRPLLRRDDKGERTNSKGLRGSREFSYERPDGMRRILLLGDSFTYGYGVGDEEVYAARLAALLPDWEILNLGVNGYGTDQQYLYWLEEGRRYAPQVVLLGYYVADFHRNTLSFRELAKPRFVVDGDHLRLQPLRATSLEEVLEESRRVESRRLRIADAASFLLRLTRSEPRASFEEKARLTKGILEMLRDSIRREGAELWVAVIPHGEVREDPGARRIEEFLANVCADLGVPVIDLVDPIRAQRERSGRPLYREHHWTAETHALAAHVIVQALPVQRAAGGEPIAQHGAASRSETSTTGAGRE